MRLRHEQSFREEIVHSEEFVQDVQLNPVEKFDVRAASWSGCREDFRIAVAVHIDGAYANASGESGIVCEELPRWNRIRSALEDTHMGAASAARSQDDLGQPIPIDITAGDVHAAREGAVKSEVRLKQRQVSP